MASSSSSSLFNLVAVLLLAAVALSASQRDAAPPAADCSSQTLLLADCLSFVSDGSTLDKPEGTCCSGLKTVLTTDANCVCEALRSTMQLGVALNLSKARTLPPACNLSAYSSAIKCSLPIPPTASPAGGEAPAFPPTIAPAPPTKSEDTAPPPTAKNSATATATNTVVGTVAAAAVAYWLFT